MILFTELSRIARIGYYEAALRSLHPLHADVPGIVIHLSHLRDPGLRGVVA